MIIKYVFMSGSIFSLGVIVFKYQIPKSIFQIGRSYGKIERH